MDKDTQRISDFRQLVHRLNEIGDKKNIAIVWAEDEHTLQAVAMAAEAGFAPHTRMFRANSQGI